jgi:CHRD domain-containing protein
VKIRMPVILAVFVVGAAALVTAAVAFDGSRFDARLSGYQETPTLSTSADGTFRASINRAGNEIRYTLSYRGPFDANAAGGTVTQAHIHLGARAVMGNISAFLCTNLGNGPAGTPACPPAPATVSGTITAAQVVGPAGQGISPGEFGELVRAIRAGATYANVHTTTFPAGEIRGQISGGDGHSHGDDQDEDD